MHGARARTPRVQAIAPRAQGALPIATTLTVAFALLVAPGLSLAANKPGEDPARPKAELKELRSRIEALRKDVASSEASQSEAADELKETEQSISDARRRLRELADQRESTLAELNSLGLQAQALGSRINEQQRHLEQLLHNQYVHRTQETPLRHLFSGNNPNQAARDLHYLSLIARSKHTLMNGLRDALAEKQKLVEATEAKNGELAKLESTHRKEQDTLVKKQAERKEVIARLGDRIQTQRGEIASMQRDEARLTRVIDDIERMLRERREAARRAEAARKAEEARRAESARREKEARKAAREPSHSGSASRRAEKDDTGKAPDAPVARNDLEPESFAFEGSLARHRGRLHLPVRGELANRFGSPRAEGRATWKGVFIRAGEGSQVKAVAPGRVVFADWLRGFGNLLIVDHGDSYLSVYGYNESLLRKVGDAVNGGDTVASVGSTGGSQDSGLYFELRHQGRAIDPLQWVSLR